jgi:hypothetical protein
MMASCHADRRSPKQVWECGNTLADQAQQSYMEEMNCLENTLSQHSFLNTNSMLMPSQ